MAGKLKALFGAQDMTQGSPRKNIALFAAPLLIGNLAQQLYNTVDAVIVGQYIGDGALAAVGASGPVLNLLLLLFMGIATGAGIVVAQYYGARQRDMLSRSVGTCILLTLISGIIIMIVGPLIAGPLMSLLRTPQDIYDMSVTYLTIIFLGMTGGGFYNILAGVLRGMGDSVTPLLFLLVACLLNIVLDIQFVVSFNMGVAGVAWATIIAQAVSALLCLVRLVLMKGQVDLNRHTLRLNREMTLRTVRLGLPSGLTQAIFSMAALVVQALTNSFGTTVIACSIVVMRVDGFAMMPNFTFGMAMTTFVGQNVGAGLLRRVDEGTREGLQMALGVSFLLTLGILFFGEYLMRLFTKTEEVVLLGMHMMRILAVGYIAMAVTQSLSGVMRGAGDTMTPMWISIITTVIIRVPIAYLWAFLTRTPANPVGSPDCIFASLLISWVLGAVITVAAYRRGKWRGKGITGVAAVE